MKPWLSINKTLFAGIVLALLVFVAMVVVSYRQTQFANNTATLVAHTEEELYAEVKVLSTITDNETGSRGFILTGVPEFLEPLEKSKINIHPEIAFLKKLTEGNIIQQKYIDSLLFYTGKRIAFSDSTVELRKEKGLEAAVQMVSTERGKFYADKIRKMISDMQEESTLTLQQRKAISVQAVATEKSILIGFAFLMLSLMIIIFWKEKQIAQQKALKNTQEQLALLSLQINQSNDAIYTLDIDRKIKTWNLGAENLYGFKREEAEGRDSNELLTTIISEEEINAAIKKMEEQEYWNGELKRTTKNGQTIYVHASTTNIREKSGKIIGYVSVSYDITEQKKLQEEINHLARIVEQSSEAIFSRGLDHRIISWNNGAEKLFGYKKEEAIGKTALELGFTALTAEQIQEKENQVIKNGTWKSEMDYYHRDGSTFFGSVTSNHIQNEKGKTTAFYSIVKDISARKLLEEKLKQANAELEAFSYSVSHDLRAPLRGIIGYTTILEEDYSSKLDEEAKRITDVIKKNTLKMGALIDDLLAFSRMGRHELIKTPVDTDAMVNEIKELQEHNNHKKISWLIHPLLPVNADSSTIRQVWVNLLSNAVKYSAKVEGQAIEVGSFKKNDSIVFYVKDNGVGFDERYKNKLFKVFQRLHGSDEFEGTGIGLAIVEKIISKHDGKVWAEAEVNKGASFYFSLPEN